MYVDDKLVMFDHVALAGALVTSDAYDFGAAVNAGTVDGMGFTVQSDGNATGPANVAVAVEVSDDGTTWREVQRTTWTLAEFNKGVKAFTVPVRKARHVRLVAHAVGGTFSGGTIFAKLGVEGPVRDQY